MYRAFLLLFPLGLWASAFAQEAIDPAFDSPYPGAGSKSIRWNGGIGMVLLDSDIYQQFSLRPNAAFGRWEIGLDLTVRLDEDGKLKEDEWDDGFDYLEKLHYVRHGEPGDPFYLRMGGLDNVTLGYGLMMRRYSNTIEYPSVKRIGVYTEGQQDRVSWKGMFNNLREFDEPGLIGARIDFEVPPSGLKLGASIAHDGNQFASMRDEDDDGVPDQLDLFADRDDVAHRSELFNEYSPAQLQWLVDNGHLPNVFPEPVKYENIAESVTLLGADLGIPLHRGRPVSLWGYAQAATIVDFGWGWSFPGLRMVAGPVEFGAEFRHYEKEFIGEFFNLSYEIERAQLASDSLFHTKESRLRSLSEADGFYTDLLISYADLGYAYSWYSHMDGVRYPPAETFYGELGLTPEKLARIDKAALYFFQPGVDGLFRERSDGTIFGGKLYVSVGSKVGLVYDHRVTYSSGQKDRTVRIETTFTF